MRDLLKLSAKALACGVLVLFACGIADMWQEFSAVRLLVRQSFGMEEFSVQMLGMIGTKFLALFLFRNCRRKRHLRTLWHGKRLLL